LAVGILAACWVLCTAERQVSMCAGVMLVGMVLCDLVGGQRAVRDWNRGERTPVARQLVVGALAVAAMATAAMLLMTFSRI